MKTTKQYFKSKIEAVKFVLTNQEIADWYKTEHSLDESTLTHESVRTYGGESGRGDIADLILNDGEENGLIEFDSYEGQYFKNV